MIADQLHPKDVIIRDGKRLTILSIWRRPDGMVEILVEEQDENLVLKRNEQVEKCGKEVMR